MPPPPPKQIQKDVTPAQLAELGKEIVHGKGTCLTCHTIGEHVPNARFPDLADVDERARTRETGFSDIDYFAQTLYEPDAYIVPGFSPGMPTINKPPIGLSDDEIRAVIAYLQSLGGKPTMTMQTPLKFGPEAVENGAASGDQASQPAAEQAAPPAAPTTGAGT
jgi:mono/diheme cytochrome c family protein